MTCHRYLILLALVVAGVASAGSARAESRRLAVVIGSNQGSGARPPLRFAEADAERMGRVLTELGGVSSENTFVLRGRGLAETRATLTAAHDRLTAWQKGLNAHTVVLFYFSGHSDGMALELGRERLTYAEVRRWLQDTKADIRLAVVDSCRSGSLLDAKGASLGPGFDIRLADNAGSSGEVLISSSASDESALESAEIGGSFFSHHLMSGLRGAADASGDGLVTLAEAYQYAFARTVTATANTVLGPQHPGYDYRLAGRGELVLTQIERPGSLIEVPAGFDRVLVIDSGRNNVMVELGPAGSRRLALQPGGYTVRAWNGDKIFERRVELDRGASLVLSANDLVPARATQPDTKGDLMSLAMAPDTAVRSPWSLAAALGAKRAVAQWTGDGLEFAPAVRLEGTRGTSWRYSGIVDVAHATNAMGYAENTFELLAGVGKERRWGQLSVGARAEVGGGFVIQKQREFPSLWSTLVTTGLSGTASWHFTPRIRAFAEFQGAVTFTKSVQSYSAQCCFGPQNEFGGGFSNLSYDRYHNIVALWRPGVWLGLHLGL